MNAEERSKLPPPECCRVCMECRKTISPSGVERNECIPGHPMQPGCGWQRERTPSVMDGVAK